MYLIKEFLVLFLLTLSIKARLRFQIRNETRKGMSAKSQKNFDSTVQGLKRLNRLQRRLFGMKNRKDTNDDNAEEGLEIPMANSNLFQGDIILTEQQVNEVISNVIKQAEEKNIDVSDIENKTDVLMREKRAITNPMYYEWEFPIPYYVDNWVDANKIQIALAGMESETCLRFTKSSTPITGKAGLRFFTGNGCYSYVGRIFSNNPQDVSIGYGCEWNGIIQHEVSHALGLKHEQSRPDRDTFVTVLTENIVPGLEGNFVKQSVDNALTYGIPYDYGSVMHYGRYDFSKNGEKTITAKVARYDESMGQYVQLSFNDIKLLNYKYCNSTCPTKITCYNGGYQNPNSCSVCKCPPFFSGNTCLNINTNIATACGTQSLTATTVAKQFTVSGALNCYYKISSVTGSKIKITVVSATLPFNDPCYTGNGLEVKFKKDKSLTGLNFCGKFTNQIVLSEDNSMLIHYVASLSNQNVTLSYVQA